MKFKKCCGLLRNAFQNGPSRADVKALANLAIERSNASEHRRRLMQGLGRPIISALSDDYRLVAIGNRVRWSKNWQTFADFLFDHIKFLLTPEWGNAELAKPDEDRHPLLVWYQKVCDFQRQHFDGSGQASTAQMIGAVKAYLSLAYDLYLCAHNAELSDKLLSRLRNRDQFEGAHYETYVIGCFAKAGFKILFENEDDVRTSHCEFTATHSITGRKYSVEAKAVGSESKRAGTSNELPKIRGKLHSALKKKAQHPRIIFIELNRKEEPAEDATPSWAQAISEEVAAAETELSIAAEPAPPAYLFVSNRGYLHDLSGPAINERIIVLGFKTVDFPPYKNAQNILEAYKARERHIEIHWLLKAMDNHGEIPMTFDDRLPEEVFRKEEVVSLRIGDRYVVPTEGGGEEAGILEEATVSGKVAYGVYRLDSGSRIICASELSDSELEAYKRSPETFFHVLRPVSKSFREPLDAFDFLYESYSKTPHNKLIEFMAGWPDIDSLRSLSQQELSEQYCARMAESIWKDVVASKQRHASDMPN